MEIHLDYMLEDILLFRQQIIQKLIYRQCNSHQKCSHFFFSELGKPIQKIHMDIQGIWANKNNLAKEQS